MPKTCLEIKTELHEWFGEGRIKKSRFYEDFAKIGSFLSDPAQYFPALRELHSEMERLFDARGSGFSGGEQLNRNLYQALAHIYETSEPGSTKGWLKNRFSKLLTEILWKNEVATGFSAGANSSQIDILIGLSGAKFNWLLKNGRPFKDIGASYQHGENSHRIQWYLISKMGNLDNSILEIYSGLVPWGTKEVYKPFGRKIYMWEFLVDRDGIPSNVSLPIKTDNQQDFRAPSNVNRYLIGGSDRDLYLLKACLSHRWGKRASDSGALAYYLRKQGLDQESITDEDMKEILMGNKALIRRH